MESILQTLQEEFHTALALTEKVPLAFIPIPLQKLGFWHCQKPILEVEWV